jgi:hypothetical protein
MMPAVRSMRRPQPLWHFVFVGAQHHKHAIVIPAPNFMPLFQDPIYEEGKVDTIPPDAAVFGHVLPAVVRQPRGGWAGCAAEVLYTVPGKVDLDPAFIDFKTQMAISP